MSIVDNKKAYHDYFIEEKFEAGVALLGWEVKAVRAGRAQIKEAYVVVKNNEIVLIGSHVTPLISTSTHVKPDATRTRKLLLHRKEINRLVGLVERAGYGKASAWGAACALFHTQGARRIDRCGYRPDPSDG